MPMLINDNTAPISTVNYYSRHTDGRQKSVLKIASGVKINGVGDNPSDWGKNERMREQIRSLDQADQNTQNDINLLKVTDGAISGIVDVVYRLQEMAINSANDHNGETERAVMQHETNQLLSQIDNIATSTTFNGKRLLDGSQAAEGLTFHIGGETNFSVQIKMESMTAESLGLNGIDLSTREGAASTLGTYNSDGTYTPSVYEKALNKLLTQQGKIGAVEEQLGFNHDTLSTTIENMQNASSTLVDTDIASEMSLYVKEDILAQATEQMLALQNKNVLSILDLLSA